MELLHLELDEDATRQSILQALEQQINPLVRNKFLRRVDALDILDEDHCHNVAEVNDKLEGLDIEDQVLEDARAVYAILASAEATAHGCAVDDTHFHEVGGGNSLRNVVAVCMAIDTLHPQRITATHVQTGHGKVQCAHGLLDIPAPATAAIIAKGIPTVDTREGEWCTPTSAALILHFVDEFIED